MEIVIEKLNQFYGKKQALKDVSLTIEEGMFGLLGKNGAGKTTLMKVLAGILKKGTGTVTVGGIPVENAKEIRAMTGYLPQDFSMYGNMSAWEALDYLGALSGLSRKERRERIPLLLEKVNLEDRQKTKVKAMSGGMRRRLGIAQAILHDPKILIVDEPTAGLDPEERVRFRNLLCETAQERIVILSTHIVGDIEATCENIGILDAGELIYRGTVAELLKMTEGRVYRAEISKLELPRLQALYPVSSMLTTGTSVTVRFLSDIPPVFPAQPCQAGVEDAYLYLMHLGKEAF